MKFGPVAIEAAEGVVLAHALALPSGTLRKGHRISAADVKSIREAGIDTIVAAVLDHGELGEDAAASRLAAILSGTGVTPRTAATGRVNLHADAAGVLLVDRARVDAFNAVDPSITVATLPEFATVAAGQMVATVKIIPFAVSSLLIEEAERAAGGSVVAVQPSRPHRVGLIQTQLPAVKPTVLDKTARVTQGRLDRSGSSLTAELRTPHDAEAVARAILEIEHTSDLILVFGASAVCDADDVIPSAISLAGGTVERVGMPVDPGNLLVLGWLAGKAVVGAPGCARSPKLNGFDWVLDRLMAGVEVTSADIAGMGVGGLLMEIPTRPQPREPRTAKPPRVDAILLAAGRASRMGGLNKLLARFDGVPLVRGIAGRIVESAGASLVVVVGHDAERVAAALGGLEARTVTNPDYATGLASSLRAGIEALPAESDGALVCLADMPAIGVEELDRLIRAFTAAGGKAVVRAVCAGRPGNPVILPRALFATTMELEGDRGARKLIEESGLEIIDVDIGESALIDVDTPQALAAAGGELPVGG